MMHQVNLMDYGLMLAVSQVGLRNFVTEGCKT